MNRKPNYPLFELEMQDFNGQTAVLSYKGSIQEFRHFYNFEFALRKDDTGYFLGSANDDDFDVEIPKENITGYEIEEPDEFFPTLGTTDVYINLINGDSLHITFVEGGEEQ